MQPYQNQSGFFYLDLFIFNFNFNSPFENSATEGKIRAIAFKSNEWKINKNETEREEVMEKALIKETQSEFYEKKKPINIV